jgi:ankyrin repeat protein
MKELDQQEDTWVLTETDERGLSGLHYACEQGHVDVLRWLLQRCPEILDETDLLGRTPLYVACSTAHTACAEMLMDLKADVDIQSIDGTTAVSHA